MKKTAKICLLTAALLISCACFIFAQDSRPIVTDISASPRSATRITVSWTLPADVTQIKSLLVFRSTQPYAAKNQLNDSAPIAKLKPETKSYIDTLSNYKEYYYAVIAQTQDDKRYDIILPSINATVNGVRVARVIQKQKTQQQSESAKEKLYTDGELREQPLPYLDMIENQSKQPLEFSEKAYECAKELAGKYTKENILPLEPYVFEDDMVSPSGGDDYYLFEILRTSFIKKKYADSAAALKKLLSVNRSESVTQRATFYLGESLYFCRDYSVSLACFLKFEDKYPVISQKWIESILSLYELPESSK